MKTAFGANPKAVALFKFRSAAVRARRKLICLIIKCQCLSALLAGVLSGTGLFACFRHFCHLRDNSVVTIIHRNTAKIHGFGKAALRIIFSLLLKFRKLVYLLRRVFHRLFIFSSNASAGIRAIPSLSSLSTISR